MSEAPAPIAEGQADPAPEAQGQATPQAAEQSWFDGADEETVGYIKNKGWEESPLKAIEGYRNLEKYQGVSPDQLLKLPKDMNEEGALDPVYDKLGRPEAPDKYELDLPEGIQVDDNRVSAMSQIAHKVGLNSQQLSALAAADAEYQASFMESLQQEQAAELTALEKEWGNAFSEREELARRAVRAFLPEGVDKEGALSAIEQAIGTANMLKMFANAGEKVSKEHGVPDSGTDRPFGYTREQAVSDKKVLMDEIKADPDRLKNYNSGVGPDIDKMKNLNKIITG